MDRACSLQISFELIGAPVTQLNPSTCMGASPVVEAKAAQLKKAGVRIGSRFMPVVGVTLNHHRAICSALTNPKRTKLLLTVQFTIWAAVSTRVGPIMQPLPLPLPLTTQVDNQGNALGGADVDGPPHKHRVPFDQL